MREQITTAIKTLIYGVIAASAGTVAFLFAVIAAFLWVQQRYDTIIASGVVGGMFILVALIALIAISVARRRAAKRQAREEAEAKAAPPSWLADPALLLTGVQIARAIGFGKIIPLALAGVAAFGAAGMMGKGSKSNKAQARRQENTERNARNVA